MKALPKNWLSLNKSTCLSLLNQKTLTCLLVFVFCIGRGQTVNYVNNGSLEQYYNCTNIFSEIKNWSSIDSISNCGVYLNVCNGYVPNHPNTIYQLPHTGKGFAATTFYNSNTTNNSRKYFKNRMKATLQAGHSYCVKFYVNIPNMTTYGNDGFGIYFGDSSIDTITKFNTPLSYLTPQVKCPDGSPIVDTLGWTLVSGSFVATGNEKYALIGIFAANGTVDTALVNPTWGPGSFTDGCIDDVSCIDINTTAYAGRDTFFIPGDSIYLGRPSDVGIDEACMWYKLPNTTTAVDTVAGFWLKPTTTCTYVVKQDICGVVKWDTIVLHQSAIGISELNNSNGIRLYPNPAQNNLSLEFSNKELSDHLMIVIYDNLGQKIREDKIVLANHKTKISIDDLSEGMYHLEISDNKNTIAIKKFVIYRQ